MKDREGGKKIRRLGGKCVAWVFLHARVAAYRKSTLSLFFFILFFCFHERVYIASKRQTKKGNKGTESTLIPKRKRFY